MWGRAFGFGRKVGKEGHVTRGDFAPKGARQEVQGAEENVPGSMSPKKPKVLSAIEDSEFH